MKSHLLAFAVGAFVAVLVASRKPEPAPVIRLRIVHEGDIAGGALPIAPLPRMPDAAFWRA